MCLVWYRVENIMFEIENIMVGCTATIHVKSLKSTTLLSNTFKLWCIFFLFLYSLSGSHMDANSARVYFISWILNSIVREMTLSWFASEMLIDVGLPSKTLLCVRLLIICTTRIVYVQLSICWRVAVSMPLKTLWSVFLCRGWTSAKVMSCQSLRRYFHWICIFKVLPYSILWYFLLKNCEVLYALLFTLANSEFLE